MIKFKLNKITQSREFKNRVIWMTALLGILFVLFIINPAKVSLTKCFFHEATGFSCPSCGLSRSLFAASHLNLSEAIHFHIMGPIIYFVILVLLVKFSLEIVAGKKIQMKVKPIIKKISIFIFLGLWFIFCLLRLINEL